jgi:hypothetical protein
MMVGLLVWVAQNDDLGMSSGSSGSTLAPSQEDENFMDISYRMGLDSDQKRLVSGWILWFTVDITIVNGDTIMVYKLNNQLITGRGANPIEISCKYHVIMITRIIKYHGKHEI